MDLNGDNVEYSCPPGEDFYAALAETLPWTDCGIKSTEPTTPPTTEPTQAPQPTGRFTRESIKAADAYCQELRAGSYCKYYQTAAGRVCQGNDKPCGHLLEEEMATTTTSLPTGIPTGKPEVDNCWVLVGESQDKRSVLMWTDEESTPSDVPRIDTSTPIAEGSVYVAQNLKESWNVGGDELTDLSEIYGIENPDLEDMQGTNLPVRRFTEVESGKAPNAFAYFASYAAAPARRSIVKKYGNKINPRTVLALH